MNTFHSSRGERLAYGSWYFGQNVIFGFVLGYLALFYTDTVGLTAAAVGTLFLVARIWDAINDPLLAAVIDRTRPKKGKFLPWINSVTFLMPIVTILVFWNIQGNGTINLVYAAISYIVWGMIYTVSDVPIFAIVTTVTDDMDERVALISIGRLMAAVASIFAAVLSAPMIDNLGWTPTVLILMGIALISMIPIRFLLKERFVDNQREPVTLKDMVSTVLKNKYLLIFYLAYICVISTNTAFTIGVYFAQWNLGNLSLQGILALTFILPLLLFPIFLPRMIKAFGKRKIFIAFVTTGNSLFPCHVLCRIPKSAPLYTHKCYTKYGSYCSHIYGADVFG